MGITAAKLCLLFQVGGVVGRKKTEIGRGGLLGSQRNSLLLFNYRFAYYRQ
jgi:hypothetical protein